MTTALIGAALLALALLVLVLVLAISLRPSEPTGVARGLALIEGTASAQSAVRSELPASERFVAPIIDGSRRLATRLSPGGTVERLANGLDKAGNPAPWTVDRIMGVKGMLLLLGLALGLLFGDISVVGVLLAVFFGAALFYLPDLLLYNASLRRQERTAKDLADVLDVLTVCVEAGQGFDGAVLRVARTTDGPLSGEFARVLSEIQLGKTRGQAFSSMGERVVLPEVKNFISAIVQADRLGIPIAKVLREQTSAMRVVRRQKAEEQAQKITVKILFPLLLCIFPAMFVVIIGPGAIRMMENIFGSGGAL
ncbi:type II secretion system F family protein [Janibacter alittae]|uniref:Type II secretion system F family protein n=1 Tax=Janibacter alittae TaxID=3115209 RepID=A0ABZ2MG38_9MICO